MLRGAFSFVWMNEDTLYAARDPQGIRPLVLGRLDRGWVVASEDAALATIGASVVREIEPGELIAIDEHGLRTHRFAEPARKGCVFEYVYLARPDATIGGQQRARRPGRDGPRAGPAVPGRGRPGDAGARVGHPRRGRLRRGERHPVRPGLRQERLRRPHLHPAQPDPAPARHPAQAQRARAHGPRQEAGRRRRLDRARQHPARPGPDAARGRRARGARADLVAAGEVAVLLRHRLRHPRRADRQRPRRRGDPRQHRRRQPRLHLARGDDRGDRPAAAERCARPASPASTRSRCPTRACSASTCSRRRSSSPTLGKALPVLNNP